MHQSLTIDVREACTLQKTGKGQWTYGFVRELLHRNIPVTLMTDCDVPKEWSRASVERISGHGLLWHWNVLRWLRKHPGITYVSPVSYIVPAFAPRTVRCIPVVHDLIAFLDEPHDRKATLIERWTLPRVVRRCSRICTISESTKRDLLHRYPHLAKESVMTIYAGPLHSHPEKNLPDGKSILSIATLCPRKNQLRLIRAFASLPDDLRSSFTLVLGGGRGWQDQDIIDEAGETSGVEWRGYIAASEYDTLLKTCTVFALPSLYEGFGMQILDALQRGIPVLTSNRGSLREVADGAALIVDPQDIESIRNGLERLLREPELRKEMSQKGRQRAEIYSWKRTVDLFLTQVEDLR